MEGDAGQVVAAGPAEEGFADGFRVEPAAVRLVEDEARSLKSAPTSSRSWHVEFRRTHGRVPSSTTPEIAERKLGARLDGILANDDKIAVLKTLDEFGLLERPEAPASIDDLLGSDDFDLLEDESGLLDVSDLPVRRQVYGGRDVARREKAQDLEQFEPLFNQKHAELREGTSKLLPYPGMTRIVPGAFFVLNGVMLFVAEVGETEYRKSTMRENKRERLRCIFENGTESSMYRQSLAIRLSDEDGQIVVQSELPEILTDDEVSGSSAARHSGSGTRP